ncbi:DUF1573 domain-containing protein [Rubripirellula reticaptiva]|uniref:DUF1573 domain-containing protein n=1 Tax=Rubripirellula reticaptiva TaxID=2528013 RepID=A0A5C6FBW9_9BACT|nr:DUF1573 domain-containing protein [Rubripirellula reticaptiva]TWU58080.1 hypothetical protein Poly59_09890 [Rubripirellula reticaptiva]
MNTLGKRMMAGIAVVASLATVAGVLIATVSYEPHGVPKALRPAFKAKIAEVKQRASEVATISSSVRPSASLDTTEFHFGLLDPHATVSHSFTVRNDGEAPLTINVQRTSCKCTVGKLGSNVILPGGQTDVTLTWNTGYQLDNYEQSATLETNDPLQPEITLTIQGDVRAELVVPSEVVMKSANPGDMPGASFTVYSQLLEDFYLDSAASDLPSFDWNVEPLSIDDTSLFDKNAKWAWRVNVSTSGKSRGKFAGDVKLTFKNANSDQVMTRTVKLAGHVRAPINFYSPDIHSKDGLDVGTLDSGKEHQFKLVVRNRVEASRRIEVTGVEPKELKANLTPTSKPGEYRLVLTFPADCPTVMFNRDSQHGYVEIGDPDDKTFSNWFPVLGAIVDLQ